MLTALTPEQEAAIVPHRQAWIDHFLDLHWNPQKTQELGNFLYRVAKFDRPVYLEFASPYACQVAANLLQSEQINHQLHCQLYDQINHQIHRQLYDQIYSQLHRQIHRQLHRQIYHQIHHHLHCQINHQINRQLHRQIYRQIHRQLGDQTYHQLGDQINRQITDQIYGQLGDQTYHQIYGQLGDQIINDSLEFVSFGYYGNWNDAGWVAFYQYFIEHCGLTHEVPLFTEYARLIRHAPILAIQLDGAYLVSRPPLYIQDNQAVFEDGQKYNVQCEDRYSARYYERAKRAQIDAGEAGIAVQCDGYEVLL